MQSISSQALRLPSIFGEHMVLQAERSNPIWGWAGSGAEVTVSFHDRKSTAKADSKGRWSCELAAAPVGGPYRLEVVSGGKSIVFTDVLAGEVWLCSGQSNMEWTVARCKDAEREIAAGDHPQIRLLNVTRVASPEPLDDIEGKWTPCTRETVANFSAVGYYFGRDIQQARNVPIGLVNSSWGGTVAESWTEWSALQDEPAFASFMEPYLKLIQNETEDFRRRKPVYAAEWMKVQRYADPGNRAFFRGWADMNFDDSGWKDFAAPALWKEPDMHHRGAVWYRRKVVVPKEWAGRDLILSLGALHDFDTSYFNGLKVGGLGKETPDAWRTPRYYRISAADVRPGEENIVATRVFVEFDFGGFTGGGPLALYPEGETPEAGLSLDGTWKYRAEYAFDATVPEWAQSLVNSHNQPSHLYNAMIAPMVPFGFTGAIWYQGESNAERAEQYKVLFPRMIENWRKVFRNADLPFFFVLLANYQPEQVMPVEPGWGEIREAQLEALKLPLTGVGSAIDVGDAKDIHPQDKQTVGHRLALAARAILHGEKIVYAGPTFSKAKAEGSRARILFTHTGTGLCTRDGQALRGFAVRGSGAASWLWAEAKIEGDSVIAGHASLPAVEEVRYAWASNPIGNLANSDGLPAVPFRALIG